MAHDVFLSHSSKDKAIADAICATLEKHAIRCWVAPRDILPGKSWPAAIIEAIEACRIMVLIVSTDSNASEQVVREVERAVNKNVIIVPFRIHAITPNKSLEYFLGCPHWLDAINPPMQQHIDQLATTITRLLKGADAAPPPAPAPEPPAPRREVRDIPPDEWGARRPARPSIFKKLFGE